jgi:carboxypeptidase C (cathepsin A)
MLRQLAFALVLTCWTASVLAQNADKAAKPEPAKTSLSQTRHSITIAGKHIEYLAEAGTMTLKEEDGKAQANVFYVAYTKTQDNPATRRLTFCFNGGPGSSSVWLHMGAFGPRRVVLSNEGEALAPAAKTVENEWSLLDLTDLVFIDPVSTGFSRAAEEKNAKQFHGVQEDLQSVGEFIRLYTTRHNRWGSPKFLAGESYGTTRASGLSNHLQSRLGMRLNGIMLISAVLNFGTIRFEEGNDLPYALFLPSYAATAWHHKKLSADLQADFKKTLTEAENFAQDEYMLALTKGLKLSEAERGAVATKVSRYTGLSQQYVLNSNLRIEGQRFMRELLRDRGQIVGRYDSRLTARDGDNAAERPDFDPSYAAVQGPYTEGWNEYVRQDLKFESDLQYEILTGRVQPWNYGNATNRYLNVAPMLKDAMTTNKYLRVFVANGYYDLATPFAATQYTFNHLGAETGLSKRVTMTYYDAGHMMYINKPSLEKLRQDITRFLTLTP